MSTLSYALACATGLNYNEQTCSGLLHGYRVSAACKNPSETHRSSRDYTTVMLYFSVSDGTYPIDEKRFTGLVDSSSNIKSIKIKDNMLQILCDSWRKSEKETVQIASAALEEAVDFFQNNGFYSCCARCGAADKETDSYVIGKTHTCLCKECAERESIRLQEEKSGRNWKNVLSGILGAVLLLLVGTAVKVLLRDTELPFVMFTAIILGLCACAGYKWLGKGITAKEIPILIILLLVFVWLAHQASYAVDAAEYWEEPFWLTYCYLLTVPPSEYLTETAGYWTELIFTAAVACVTAAILALVVIKNEKDSSVLCKL